MTRERVVIDTNVLIGSLFFTTSTPAQAVDKNNLTHAQAAPLLGRPLAGTTGLPTQNRSINILLPGELYAERINQVDMRAAKVLRFGFGNGSGWLRLPQVRLLQVRLFFLYAQHSNDVRQVAGRGVRDARDLVRPRTLGITCSHR